MQDLIEKIPIDFNTVHWHTSAAIPKCIYSLNEYVYLEHHECDFTFSIDDVVESKFTCLYRNYKYKGDKTSVDELISYIIGKLSAISDIEECQFIIPAPSNSKEKRFAILIKKLSEKLNLKFMDILTTDLNCKIKNVEVGKRGSMSGFITCKQNIGEDAKILLIDDFLETGTTLRECVKAITEKNPHCEIVPVIFFRKHNTLKELK